MDLHPPARVAGQRDLLGDAGQPGDRREPGSRHRPAEQGRGEHPDGAQRRQRRADGGELLVGGGERLRHLDGKAVREVLGVDHGPGSVDLRVDVERGRLARGHADRFLARREPPGVARRRPHDAGRRDHLGVVKRAEPGRARHPVIRDAAVVLLGLVLDRFRAGGDLRTDLVSQVGADRQEGDRGDGERDGRHRTGGDQGEPALQGQAYLHHLARST
jgi:hypothetical protein